MRDIAQTFLITLAAIMASVLVFSIFMFLYSGIAPLELYQLMYKGSCGSTFSTIQRL